MFPPFKSGDGDSFQLTGTFSKVGSLRFWVFSEVYEGPSVIQTLSSSKERVDIMY